MTKNILFIIPEMSMGGAQRSLSMISSALMPFFTVFIVVFNKNHELAAIHTGEVLSLNVESGSNPLVKFIAFCSRIIRLRRLKRKLSIDVSISFLEGADYVNILSKGREKVVVSVRGSKVYDENMVRGFFFWRRFLIKLLYSRADAIVCVNKGIKDEMYSYYNLKRVPLHIIYNFYDLESIVRMSNLPLPGKVQGLFQHQTIVMSGRLAVEKGHPFVIRLFVELRKTHTDLRFVIVGDGPERESIIKLCESLNLDVAYKEFPDTRVPDIFITGEQLNVFHYLKPATFYVLNSSSEGFPNGLAEAMACGLPVVAADCPYGPGEMLSLSQWNAGTNKVEFAEYGILLPLPGSVSKQMVYDIWIEAIHQLLNSVEIRNKYSKLSIKRVREFSEASSVNQWREIIEF